MKNKSNDLTSEWYIHDCIKLEIDRLTCYPELFRLRQALFAGDRGPSCTRHAQKMPCTSYHGPEQQRYEFSALFAHSRGLGGLIELETVTRTLFRTGCLWPLQYPALAPPPGSRSIAPVCLPPVRYPHAPRACTPEIEGITTIIQYSIAHCMTVIQVT